MTRLHICTYSACVSRPDISSFLYFYIGVNRALEMQLKIVYIHLRDRAHRWYCIIIFIYFLDTAAHWYRTNSRMMIVLADKEFNKKNIINYVLTQFKLGPRSWTLKFNVWRIIIVWKYLFIIVVEISNLVGVSIGSSSNIV